MNLDNSFDFTEFEKLSKKPRVPEETLSSLTDIYTIACSVLLKSPIIVIFFLFIISMMSGFSAYHTKLNFNQELFWLAVAENDLVYIQQASQPIIMIFLLNLTLAILVTILNNIVYSGVSGKSKGTELEKIGFIGSLIARKFIIIALVVIAKSFLITAGMLLFLIPGIILWMSMLLIEYVIIFENKGFIESWKRSNELMAGCKGNFITFISIASLLIIPIYIIKVFFNFDADFSSFMGGDTVGLRILVSLIVEMAVNFLYGAYFCGTCLLYMKRTQIFNNLEMENKNAE